MMKHDHKLTQITGKSSIQDRLICIRCFRTARQLRISLRELATNHKSLQA